MRRTKRNQFISFFPLSLYYFKYSTSKIFVKWGGQGGRRLGPFASRLCLYELYPRLFLVSRQKSGVFRTPALSFHRPKGKCPQQVLLNNIEKSHNWQHDPESGSAHFAPLNTPVSDKRCDGHWKGLRFHSGNYEGN